MNATSTKKNESNGNEYWDLARQMCNCNLVGFTPKFYRWISDEEMLLYALASVYRKTFNNSSRWKVEEAGT